MADRIGTRRCPLCGAAGAHVSLSKKGLTCCTCNACKSQTFARGPRSDGLLREGTTRAEAAPPAEPTTTAPAPAAKPAPAPVTTAPAPAPQPRGWGLLG